MTPQPNAAKNSIKFSDWSIVQLPGLSAQDCAQLSECGINTTVQLLVKANTSDKKLALANQLQKPLHHIQKWVALADLARIPSVGCQYCGLLLHAGIASVNQLAQTSAHKVHQQILKLQVSTMQRRDLCPPVEEVSRWIQQAKTLVSKSQKAS